MDGFEVASYLKKSSKTKKIPIIFLTAAFKSEEMREKGLHLGAVDYLHKPIDPIIFIPKIIHYIEFYVTTHELMIINMELEQKVKDAVEQNSIIEAKLHQSEKLASMGEMISNIAHQWRQPISIISMWANNILVDVDMDEVDNNTLKEYANNINEQTKHLSQTIEDFRNFFAPNKEKNTFFLQDSINKTMSLLTASFKTHSIELIENIEDIKITALENELTQAILNIIKNAKDILTTLEKDVRRLIFINIFKKENNAIIEIIDNGGGVNKDIADKVFEPYFTTKHKSQGTGIGLYMTETIITKHLHSEVNIKNIVYEYENKKYIGALFKIVLPRA